MFPGLGKTGELLFLLININKNKLLMAGNGFIFAIKFSQSPASGDGGNPGKYGRVKLKTERKQEFKEF